MWGRFSAIAGILVLLASPAAQAGSRISDARLAWFQPGNIYHSGLRGTLPVREAKSTETSVAANR